MNPRMRVIYCYACGERLVLDEDEIRTTQRMDADELEAMLPQAIRSPIPPPAPSSEPALTYVANAADRDTLPDIGWLTRHLRLQQHRRMVGAALLILAVLGILIVLAWVTK